MHAFIKHHQKTLSHVVGNPTYFVCGANSKHIVWSGGKHFCLPLSCQQLTSSKPSQGALRAGCCWTPGTPHVLGLSELPEPHRPCKTVSRAAAPQTPASMAFGCKPQRHSPRKHTEITFWLRPRAVHHIVPTADWKRPTHGDSFLMAEAVEKTHKHFLILQKTF